MILDSELRDLRAVAATLHETPVIASMLSRAVDEIERLRAEVAAMQPVVNAASDYCLSPSGCMWRTEAALVEVTGMYIAKKRLAEQQAALAGEGDG